MTNTSSNTEGGNDLPPIQPDQQLRDLIVAHPHLRVPLEQLEIDYCCGGKKTLKEAVSEAGLNLESVMNDLRKIHPQPADDATEKDWNTVSLTALVDHILEKHHTFLKTHLPRLDDLLKKVQAAHQTRHGEMLAKLRRFFDSLRSEIELHLMKEEEILFPAIKGIDAFMAGAGPRPIVHCGQGAQGTSIHAHNAGAGPRPIVHCGSVANPIRQMEFEHDNAGAMLKEIRLATDDYHLPEDACASFAALYEGLAALEADLHEHIHLENNILFPKSIVQESSMS